MRTSGRDRSARQVCSFPRAYLLFLTMLSGCEIFKTEPDLSKLTEPNTPKLKMQIDAVQLEVVYVERPLGDPLMGDRLWNDVEQILNFDPEVNKNLTANGFRIGIVSDPPKALTEMLGLRSNHDERSPSDEKLEGNRLFIRTGQDATMLVSPNYEKADLTLVPLHTMGATENRHYKNAQCLFRVTAHREQDGWGRLEFLPEIHYGQNLLRPTPKDEQWEMEASQLIDRFLGQRFSVMLNAGDMVLITGLPNAKASAGNLFFIGPQGAQTMQRLFVVRLVRVGKTESQ